MAELFLPTLHTFAMNNIFTGSAGLFRFRVKPNVIMATPKEVDFEQSTIRAEYWHGLYCYEKSEMEGAAEFPMTEEGRKDLLAWLEVPQLMLRRFSSEDFLLSPIKTVDFYVNLCV